MCGRATTVGDIRLSIKTKPLGMVFDDSRHTSTKRGRTAASPAQRHPAARWKVPCSRARCRCVADIAHSPSAACATINAAKPSYHRSTRFCRAAISRLAFWGIQALRAWLFQKDFHHRLKNCKWLCPWHAVDAASAANTDLQLASVKGFHQLSQLAQGMQSIVTVSERASVPHAPGFLRFQPCSAHLQTLTEVLEIAAVCEAQETCKAVLAGESEKALTTVS